MEKKKTVKPTTKTPTPKKAEKQELVFEEEDQKVGSITTEQHEQMLTLIKDLTSKVERLEAEKSNITVAPTVEADSNLTDDYLEIPITFFSYSIKFRLYGDKRKGKVVGTPTGDAITFEPYYRYNVKNRGRRGTETVSICRATVQSKSTVEWLRNHSQFGIKFFENIKSAVDQDVYLAEKMVQVSNMVSNMGDMKIIDRARQEGINISDPDINNIKQQLIKKIATSQIKSEKNSRLAVAKTLGTVEEKIISNSSKQAEKGDVNDVY